MCEFSLLPNFKMWTRSEEVQDEAAASFDSSLSHLFTILTGSLSLFTSTDAAPKPNHPIITPDLLAELDGFIFCFPTRYGRAPAQVSTFFDRTGGLWASGKLIGKFGGIGELCSEV